jgi:hypothetical protein
VKAVRDNRDGARRISEAELDQRDREVQSEDAVKNPDDL